MTLYRCLATVHGSRGLDEGRGDAPYARVRRKRPEPLFTDTVARPCYHTVVADGEESRKLIEQNRKRIEQNDAILEEVRRENRRLAVSG